MSRFLNCTHDCQRSVFSEFLLSGCGRTLQRVAQMLLALVTLLITEVRAEGQMLSRIRVSADGTHFVAGDSEAAFRPMGFNYDHDAEGRLIEDYWHIEWERIENDFQDMQALGANVVRIHLQFGRFMISESEANPAELSRLEKLLDLAERCRLYLDLTGLGCYHKHDVPQWYDALDQARRWQAQEVFWTAVASVCSSSNAVFCYDLMNEPVIGGEQPAADWLGPPFGGKHFVQFVARQTAGQPRPAIAKQWIDQMAAAIRRRDPTHLITVGMVDWSLDRPGLTSGFDPRQVSGNLDFLAVHIYPKSGKAGDALQTLDGFQIGKPVLIEETFPLSCSMDDMLGFMNQADDRADGWISFFWGKQPDEYNPKGSIADAVSAEWIRRFSARCQAEASSNSPAGAAKADPVVDDFLRHLRQHQDGQAAFSIDSSAWQSDVRSLPIGVFDSGIGGLTVLEAILKLDAFDNQRLTPGADGKRDFENEQFIYFGDQANMPYGNYPAAERTQYLRELILKDAVFLLGRRYWRSPSDAVPGFDKPPVKAIVIACNTATAFGVEDIRRLAAEWKIPVITVGVVEAGARGVLQVTGGENSNRTVAVLATVGTCSIDAYPRAIARAAGQAGRRQPTVLQQGSLGLAGAIEGDPAFVRSELQSNASPEYLGPSVSHKTAQINSRLLAAYGFDPSGVLGDLSKPDTIRLNSPVNYIRYDVTTLVENYRGSGGITPIDTVVLGCTHFPLITSEIRSAFASLRSREINGERPYANLIAETVEVVDPAELTARELFREIAAAGVRRSSGEEPEMDLFFLSVPNPRCSAARISASGNLEKDYKYGRVAGNLGLEDTLCVPFSSGALPITSSHLIQSRLPSVWTRLLKFTEDKRWHAGNGPTAN